MIKTTVAMLALALCACEQRTTTQQFDTESLELQQRILREQEYTNTLIRRTEQQRQSDDFWRK